MTVSFDSPVKGGDTVEMTCAWNSDGRPGHSMIYWDRKIRTETQEDMTETETLKRITTLHNKHCATTDFILYNSGP